MTRGYEDKNGDTRIQGRADGQMIICGYRDRQTEVSMRIECRTDSGQWRLSVRDNFMGIVKKTHIEEILALPLIYYQYFLVFF